MRAVYEQYHELKSVLSTVKGELERRYGSPVPEEVLLGDETPRERVKRGPASSSVSISLNTTSPPSNDSHSNNANMINFSSLAVSPVDTIPSPRVGRSRSGSFDSSVSADQSNFSGYDTPVTPLANVGNVHANVREIVSPGSASGVSTNDRSTTIGQAGRGREPTSAVSGTSTLTTSPLPASPSPSGGNQIQDLELEKKRLLTSLKAYEKYV